jgi:hypothetical protein
MFGALLEYDFTDELRIEQLVDVEQSIVPVDGRLPQIAEGFTDKKHFLTSKSGYSKLGLTNADRKDL